MVNAYPYLITIAHRAPTTIAVEIESKRSSPYVWFPLTHGIVEAGMQWEGMNSPRIRQNNSFGGPRALDAWSMTWEAHGKRKWGSAFGRAL